MMTGSGPDPMKFSLKALMTRSMASGAPGVSENVSDTASDMGLAASTRRSMNWLTLAALVAGGALFAVAVVGALFFTFRPETLRIAVGPTGSEDAKMIQSIAQGFGRERNIRLRVVSTNSGADSAALLTAGKADLAVVRGDIDLPRNAQAVAVLRKNVVTIWTPAGLSKNVVAASKAAKATKAAKGADKNAPVPARIENLTGRKIGLVGNSAANAALLKTILFQYGVDPAKVTITQFSTGAVAEAVREQKVDAFMAVGPVNSRITMDAIAASVREGGEPTFFSIDAAEAISQNNPIYEAAEIPAGSFSAAPARPDDTIKSIGFSHYIVARSDMSETTAASFTRQLFSVRQSVMGENPGVARIETPDTDKDAAIPAHPGAAAYVDGEERTFLDRYSDYMWGGLMLLSVMGSAGAWFASYMRRDERVANSSQRDRLLDMITLARNSNSIDELDQMQTEADQILRNTLACFEDGAIEEGSLTAFNIALDQFHNAVADRKSLLNSQPTLLRAAAQLRA
jgi:TRAP-type uncharacterized transport system substrate-binding protein